MCPDRIIIWFNLVFPPFNFAQQSHNYRGLYCVVIISHKYLIFYYLCVIFYIDLLLLTGLSLLLC